MLFRSETLLAAVPSWKLLVGKLIGNLAGSLLTILIYLACIYAVLKLRGWEEWFPTENIPWLVLFQSFGVLFYSSLFMIVGSSVRDYKEAQSCLLPFWMLLILPTILSIKFTTDPGGTLATWCSMIPLTSPMTNVILVTGKLPPPTWQLIVSLLILASTACFSVWAAGRIYRASMLRTDSANSFLQMIKRINSPS